MNRKWKYIRSNGTIIDYILTRSFFLNFRLNDAYGGRPVITYRDLDAPRDGDEY